MPSAKLTGFVLAGGRSTRMGQDKALLAWHGITLLEHMLHLLQGVADEVHVAGRGQLPDRRPGLGPLSGIATALEISPTDANLFVAVDLPHLTLNFFKYLRLRLENSTQLVLACKFQSDFPLCLGIRRSLLPEIQGRLDAGRLSVRGLIEDNESELIIEDELRRDGFDPRLLFANLNTPDDYRKMM
jgi:molybdopterin-guanine dinucleotide biosynthesis protein A